MFGETALLDELAALAALAADDEETDPAGVLAAEVDADSADDTETVVNASTADVELDTAADADADADASADDTGLPEGLNEAAVGQPKISLGKTSLEAKVLADRMYGTGVTEFTA